MYTIDQLLTTFQQQMSLMYFHKLGIWIKIVSVKVVLHRGGGGMAGPFGCQREKGDGG